MHYWNNKLRGSMGDRLYSYSLLSKGISHVEDLLNTEGHFKSWNETSLCYNNLGPLEFLEWYGLIQSLPSWWRQHIKSNMSNVDSIKTQHYRSGMFIQGKFHNTEHIASKMVYQQYIRIIEKPLTAKLYFEKSMIWILECGRKYIC